MRYILFCLLIFVFETVSAEESDSSSIIKEKFSIGVKSGAAQGILKWHTLPEVGAAGVYKENTKLSYGSIVGLQTEYRFNKKIGLQSAVYYLQRFGSFSYIKTNDTVTSLHRKTASDYIYKTKHIDVDLLLKYRTTNENFYFFSTAGLFYSYMLDAKRIQTDFTFTCKEDGTAAGPFLIYGDEFNGNDNSKNNYKSAITDLKKHNIGLTLSFGLAKRIGNGNLFFELKANRGLMDEIDENFLELLRDRFQQDIYEDAHKYSFNTSVMLGYSYVLKGKKKE